MSVAKQKEVKGTILESNPQPKTLAMKNDSFWLR